MNAKNLTPDQLTQRRKTNAKILKFGCLPIALLFVFMIILINLTGSDNKTETEIKQPEDLSVMAYLISKEYAKNYLTYPAEANFDFMPVSKNSLGDNTYEVVGNVETKNGFGVKINKTYKAIMKFTGGEPAAASSWQLVKDIEFN